MSEYKTAMKRLRSIAPDICDAVQAHAATLRRQIEGERTARLSAKRETPSVTSVPVPDETQLQVRVRHLEKQVESMRRCLDEAKCTAHSRDVFQKYIGFGKAAIATCMFLGRCGIDFDMDTALPYIMANIARRMSGEANISFPKAVALLVNATAKRAHRRKIAADVLSSYGQHKDRIEQEVRLLGELR